jgi:hypothetical protein
MDAVTHLFTVSMYTGNNAITREQATPIFEQVHAALHQGQDVILNFDGVDVVCGPFLNVLFGQLYKDLSSEQLRAHLHVHGMKPWQIQVLNIVCESARGHYRKVAIGSS